MYQQQINLVSKILDKYIISENEMDFSPIVAELGEVYLEIAILHFCQKKGISGHIAQEICQLKDSISGKYVTFSEGKMLRMRTGLAFVSTKKQIFLPKFGNLQQEKAAFFGKIKQ